MNRKTEKTTFLKSLLSAAFAVLSRHEQSDDRSDKGNIREADFSERSRDIDLNQANDYFHYDNLGVYPTRKF